MIKAVIISDTHGNLGAIEKLLPIMKESDAVFHLGDFSSDIKPFSGEIKKLYSVNGNCDGGGEDLIAEIGGLKILLTHGDRYGVKTSMLKLLLRAKEAKVQAVFYGHTHIPREKTVEGIKFINPGSMTRYGEKTYCYAVIDKGKIISKIVPLYDL